MKSIVVHPENPDIIYACGNYYSKDINKAVLLISRDGGSKWDICTPEISDKTTLSNIFINPSNSDIFHLTGYEVTEGRLVPLLYKSIDGGNSFTKERSFYKDEILNIVYDPQNNKKLYAVSYDAVLISKDGGLSWNTGANFPEKILLLFPSFKDNSLVVFTRLEAFKSTDEGNTWAKTNYFAKDPFINNYFCTAFNSIVYTSQKDGLYFLEPGSFDWKMIKNNFSSSKVCDIELSPYKQNEIYFSLSSMGMYKSDIPLSTDYTNSKLDYNRIDKFPYNCHDIRDIIFDPDNPNIVYAYDGG